MLLNLDIMTIFCWPVPRVVFIQPSVYFRNLSCLVQCAFLFKISYFQFCSSPYKPGKSRYSLITFV